MFHDSSRSTRKHVGKRIARRKGLVLVKLHMKESVLRDRFVMTKLKNTRIYIKVYQTPKAATYYREKIRLFKDNLDNSW